MIENNIINGINIYVDEVYPDIKNIRINKEILKELYKALSSPKGELTAVIQYMYQHISFPKNLYEVKNAIKKISIVEIKHYEIISEIIKNSNHNPFLGYYNEKNNFEVWNASFVDYTNDLKKGIENNKLSEEEAIIHYKYILSISNNEELNQIIKRIIKDEENHLKIFKSILNQLI